MTTKSEGMMIPGKLKWYVILALALWLAFSGVAAAEQLYVNESGWWRVAGAFNASGTPIQAAVGNVTAGDSIYVWNGSYNENVDVYKRLTLEGEGADVVTVTAASSGDHVFWVTANYVEISGFAVRGATDSYTAGICLGNADHCNISENNVYGNYRGIYLSSSSNNTLTNNTANSNNGNGIGMESSSNYNTLTNNTVSDNGVGVGIESSSNNTLKSNTANSNGNGIYMDHSSNYNTLESNTANSNNNVGIGMDHSRNNTLKSNTANSNDWGGICLWRSSNNTLKSNTANSNSHGIHFYDTDNNNIACNRVQNNTQYGFRLYNADNNNIACNLVQNNIERGFYIHSGSTGNNVSYNNIIENGGYNAASGGWEWQFYSDQYNPVEAKHNYWGAGMNNSTIDASIYDDEEGGWGEVEFYPFETEPVTPVNIPPIASFTHYPLNPIVNQMVTFNASNSADSDGTITNYEWDFGDGNTTNTAEETITHFYTSAEDYTVNLTVADDEGATNSTSKAITVYPPTIIHVPDDYAKIQWAVNNASAGDTIFVWNGSYNENVNVNKRLTLEGEGADVVTVTAADSGDHVFEVVDVNYVNISGFTVRGATDSYIAGIYLGNADYCNISVNNIYGNCRGILLSSSNSNILANNIISGNHRGIGMKSSSNYNTLTNNTVNSNHDYGIYLDHSSNHNTLENNTANSNSHGIYMEDSNSNVLANNTVSDNGVGIGIESSSNNTLENNTANSNNWGGICLWRSSNNTLKSNTANSNSHGIHLYNADNNNITCSLVQNNTERGFCLHSGSTGNTIEDNNIIENGNYNTKTGGWEWQFNIEQYQPVEAKHNYWGAGMNNSTIDASIYDDEEGGWGEVEFYPFETEPVPCAPTPEEPHTFTTTDAVIALQIAAGSRPHDTRWDVSGDGSVTSLDALMILQAAAANREVPIGGCEGLDQNVLRRYDHNKNGLIDSNEMETAIIDLDEGRITQSEYDQVKYAYEHNCPVEAADAPSNTR